MKKGLIVKIPRFLLLCWIAVIFHPSAFAAEPQQNLNKEKIDLRLDQTTIAESLKIIEQKTGLAFCFYEEIINKQTVKVSLNITQASVSEVLTEVLRSTDLTYKETPNCIVIEKKVKPESTSNSASGFGSLRGRVVEAETSEPLPGANVVLVGTQLGTSTDAEGYYQFPKVPSGKYTLEVSFIGFQKTNIDVQVTASKTATYNVKMSGDAQALDEVTVSAVRKERGSVPHMTEKMMVYEIRSLQVVASGISSEQISRSADRNAADVVKKIAGVSVRDDKFIVVRGMNERYNLTYLNDNVAPSTELYSRAFALNLLPTRVIDKILVYKTASPEMLGDMAGGAVKIYTKDAVAVRHFDMEVNIGARSNTFFSDGFLTHEGSSTDFLGFDDGLRKLPSVVPGYGDFTKANISQQQYARSFSNVLSPSKKTVLPNLSFTANYYNAFPLGGEKSLSFLSSLSYKNENQQYDISRKQSTYNSSVARSYNLIDETQSKETAQMTWLNNFSLRLNGRNTIHFKNFLLQEGVQNTTYNTGKNGWTWTNWTTEGYPEGYAWKPSQSGLYRSNSRNIILGYTQRFLYSGNLSGEHQLDAAGKHRLNWNGGYAHSLQTIPDQRLIRLKKTNRTQYMYLPDPTGTQYLAAVRESGDGLYTSYIDDVNRGIISRTWARNNENVYDASLDYNFKITPWAMLKAGTFHQWKERIMFRRVYTVNEGDVTASGYPDQSVIGAVGGNYMDFQRVLFKEQDLANVWSSEYLRDDGSILKVVDRTGGSDAYKATEQQNSGYAMLALTPFGGKLDISGGVRAEYDRQRVTAAIPGVSGASGLNFPVHVDIEKLLWLPSVNISYKPWEWIVLRGAYGKTVNRPEFRELSPFSELDYQNYQQISGNADLTFSEIRSYDLRFEWYPASSGSNQFTVGGFYKEIDRPIERTLKKTVRNSGPTDISFRNAQSATVKGLEIEMRQNLDFLPGSFFRNFSIAGNYAWIKSEVKDEVPYGSTVDPQYYHIRRRLQGQAPYILNLGLYYDNAAWGTKAAIIYNRIGSQIAAASVGVPFDPDSGGYEPYSGEEGSLIELTRSQFDFALTQRIGKGLQMKFSVQNILNPLIETASDENFTYKYEKVEFNEDGSYKSGDWIFNSYKTRPFFNLNISYSF